MFQEQSNLMSLQLDQFSERFYLSHLNFAAKLSFALTAMYEKMDAVLFSFFHWGYSRSSGSRWKSIPEIQLICGWVVPWGEHPRPLPGSGKKSTT